MREEVVMAQLRSEEGEKFMSDTVDRVLSEAFAIKDENVTQYLPALLANISGILLARAHCLHRISIEMLGENEPLPPIEETLRVYMWHMMFIVGTSAGRYAENNYEEMHDAAFGKGETKQ